jgi:O-acetyl-ADP-ribose deacetylase (regulator of RNase III)
MRDVKVRLGQTDVVLERGDITEAEVDAIVNAANSQLTMGAGVAGAIKRKGGLIIEEEAVRQGPVEVGDVVVTTAGNLAANYVIHATVMGADLRASADRVRQATLATLRRAEDLKLHTLAMPAFGTGVGRMLPRDCAEAMVGALRSHFAEVSGSTLRRIHLVLFQDDTYQAFGELLGLSSNRRAG